MVCRRIAATEDLRAAMKVPDTSPTTSPGRGTRLRRTRSQPSVERRASLRRRRSFGGNGRRQRSSDEGSPNSQPQSETVCRDSNPHEVSHRVGLSRSNHGHSVGCQRLAEALADLGREERRLREEAQRERGETLSPGGNEQPEEYLHQVAQASGIILRVLGDEFNDLYAGTGEPCRPPTPSHHR